MVIYTNLLFEEYIIDWNIEKNLLGNTPVPEGNFNVMGLLLLLWIGLEAIETTSEETVSRLVDEFSTFVEKQLCC